jgi:protein-disulfide isomerase
MPFHKRAVLAHRAAVAAGDQGKFWEMHDRLFASQDRLDMESLRAHAAALDLDLGRFEEQMASPDSAAPLLADEEEARKLGIEGVPAYFLNGRYLTGTLPYEALRERIESELKARKPQ